MKVLLKDDVKDVGKRGDVVMVKDGFARNYLLPRNLALEVTPGNMKIIEEERQAQRRREAKEKSEAQGLSERISAVSCVIPVKVGEEDKMYGAITSQHIAEALEKEGIKISKKNIELESPIKTLGVYEVPIRLHPQLTMKFRVEVVKEEE
jgi:large subunit ribosomal protein L9